jgi:cell division transport system permease protein
MYRSEILIMQLVGADRDFIYIPFILEGALKGLIGSLIGLSVLWITWNVLQAQLGSLAIVEIIEPDLHFLGIVTCVCILLLGTIVGAVASFITVRRFSKELHL